MLLLALGLWDVVSQGVQTSTKSESSKEDSTGHTEPADLRADAKARTHIMSLCSQDTLQHILLLQTAKEQWEALKALYQPLGRQQLGAKIQAFTAYMPPTEKASVTIVATELSTLQAEIGEIDARERPLENAKIAVFLRAIRLLDPRFDPLILQLEISNALDSYPLIVTKFQEFERRMGPKEPAKEGAYSANDGAKAPKEKPKFKGKCYNCSRAGHRARDCKAPKKDAEGTTPSPSTGPLPTPTRGRGLSPSPRKPEASGEYATAKTAVEASWAAYTKAPSQGLETLKELLWVVDSGATRHMTYCKDAFTEYSALQKPIAIQTANGAEIQAIGQGTVVLKVPVEGRTSLIGLTNVLYVPGLAGSLVSVTQL